MADPQEQLDILTKLKSMLEELAKSGDITGDVFNKLKNAVSDVSQKLQDGTVITEKHKDQLNLVAAAAGKATSQYTAMSSVDFSGMTKQLRDISVAMGNGTVGLGQLASSTGTFRRAGEAIDVFKERVFKSAAALTTKADNMLRLESGYISLAGRTGDLGKIMNATGMDFNELSKLTETQAYLIKDTASATNIGKEEAEKYYTVFGRVPGMLTSVVQTGTEAGETINAMTAAIKVAHGTGKDAYEIQQQLNMAYHNYGLVGEEALNLTVKMNEAQRNTGLTTEMLNNALTSTASSLRGVADQGEAANRMAEGATSIYNNYVQALKATGVTADYAAGMVQNMTAQVRSMNTAQKAFLSAQTGGPGGLMGSFQIDKMLKEGDIEGVFNKVRQQMQKQLGSIVTLEEAAASPAAAAQMARQKTMLQSGPLGSMVKSDEDAYRLLESMKTGGPPPTALGDTVQQAMDRGTQMEQRRSLPIAQDIRDLLYAADIGGGMAALKLLQAGIQAPGVKAEVEAGMRQSALQTGTITERTSKAFDLGTTRELEGIASESLTGTFDHIKKTVMTLPEFAISIKDEFMNVLSDEQPADVLRNKYEELRNEAEKKADELAKSGHKAQAKELLAKTASIGKDLEGSLTPPELRNLVEIDSVEARASKILGKDTTKSVSLAESGNTENITQVARQRQHAEQPIKDVHLQITAICEHCRTPLLTQHMHATSPAAVPR